MRLALEQHEMGIDMGARRWLPYVVTRGNELLVNGAAWTALVAGSDNVFAGSMRLCSLARRYPQLAHQNRTLRGKKSLKHMAYKLDRHIFLTIEGARLVVRKCCSGVLGKRHHRPIADPHLIQGKIDGIRRALLAGLQAACDDILARRAPDAIAVVDEPTPDAIPALFDIFTCTIDLVDASGKSHSLPYIVTRHYEVLVQGSAWVASLTGCENNTIGSKKLTDIIKKAPHLFHCGRILKHGPPLTELSYKKEKNIFLTIAGAKEVVNLCNSGLLSKRHYVERGETDADQIMRTILNIKTNAMLRMDTECAAIVARRRTANRAVVVN